MIGTVFLILLSRRSVPPFVSDIGPGFSTPLFLEFPEGQVACESIERTSFQPTLLFLARKLTFSYFFFAKRPRVSMLPGLRTSSQ